MGYREIQIFYGSLLIKNITNDKNKNNIDLLIGFGSLYKL